MQKERDMVTKPSELGPAFGSRFLRALSIIKQKRSRSSSSSIIRRSRNIKLAADTSMALAVGTRRAWSRCILRRALKARAVRAIPRSYVMEERKRKKKKKVLSRPSTYAASISNQAHRLRQLIPGGESMDLCSLLDETGHYMKCLSTQVQVMKHIVDSLSI